jgi:hypothetical protein
LLVPVESGAGGVSEGEITGNGSRETVDRVISGRDDGNGSRGGRGKVAHECGLAGTVESGIKGVHPSRVVALEREKGNGFDGSGKLHGSP